MFRIIILLVALVAGGGAAWIAFTMRAEPAAPITVQEAAPPATSDVLVATTDLMPGQVLTKESMRWQSWPESAVLPAYVGRSTRPDALTGMVGTVVRSKLIAGEPIRDDKLGPVSNGLLSSMLPAGKRAVAARITAEKTAGGLILPNDRVDVLHTLESADKAEGQKDFTTRTILTNIAVLAVDQTLNETNKDEKGKQKAAPIGKTVTLELDPRQAEVLVAAEASGTISLALRSAADNAEVAPPPPKPEPLKVASHPVVEPVVVLRGGSGAPAAPKSP
jgi:pilus assembly protein CpaB